MALLCRSFLIWRQIDKPHLITPVSTGKFTFAVPAAQDECLAHPSTFSDTSISIELIVKAFHESVSDGRFFHVTHVC